MIPDTAAELAQAIRSDAAVRDDYIEFYPVKTASTDPPIDQQNWKAFACAQTELSTEAFATCYCGTTFSGCQVQTIQARLSGECSAVIRGIEAQRDGCALRWPRPQVSKIA